jgi:L-ascorbate metabolism protein UlaG (beta-lactamase superfamily)
MKITCTFIGHSTNFIQYDKATFLTDPLFGDRVLWAKRKGDFPVPLNSLASPTAILLSHAHPAHLNISSYKYISCDTPIFVPEGTAKAIGGHVPNTIIELNHFSSHELADGITITAVPVKHISGRYSHLRYRGNNAYIISQQNETKYRLLFCADSAYGDHFTHIGELGPLDIALLPIGGYKPKFLARHFAMTPAQALQAFEDLKASHFIPIHHGTFRLSLENVDEPRATLEKILEQREDLRKKIHPLAPGETFTFEKH